MVVMSALKVLVAVAFFAVALSPAPAEPRKAKAAGSLGQNILKKLDEGMRLETDVTAKITLVQSRASHGKRRFEMVYYRRDREDSFLIVMLAPNTEKGNGYLKVGKNFWMYRKNTRTFQHISRDENIGGTDLQAGDLEQRKMTELFAVRTNADGTERLEQTTLGKAKVPVVAIGIAARVDDVTYPIQTLFVGRESHLVLKVENYSRSGRLLLTQYYPKYTQIKGRHTPIRGYSLDAIEKQNKTFFEVNNLSTKPIPNNVFTKAYLENLSR